MAGKRKWDVWSRNVGKVLVVADGFRLADGDLAFHDGKGGDAELVVAFARGEWDVVKVVQDDVA